MHIIHHYAIYAIIFAILALLVAKFMDFTAYKTDKQINNDLKTWFIGQNSIKIGSRNINYRKIYVLVTGFALFLSLLFL